MATLQVKNEAVINASAAAIWSIITDITLLPQINNSIIKVSGSIDRVNGTRVCEIDNNGRIAQSTETITAIVEEKNICWKVDHDTLGRGSKLKELQYRISLEKMGNDRTKVSFETYYDPCNFFMHLLNFWIIKRKISMAQEKMLSNLKSLCRLL
jgi:hypothetical protein